MQQPNKSSHNEKPTHLFREEQMGFITAHRTSEQPVLFELLPKVYQVRTIQTPVNKFVALFDGETVSPPARIYGDVLKNVTRFFKSFEARKENLGVHLIGVKGSGKTMTALCMIKTALESGMPVLLVNEVQDPIEFAELMAAIKQDCLVVYDEFDKTHGEIAENSSVADDQHTQQSGLLRVLDGACGGGKKLFVFISNDPNRISPYLIKRPGRIRYTKDFKEVEIDVVNEYVKENLRGWTDVNLLHFHKFVKFEFANINFDMVRAIVEEMNMFGGSVFDNFKLMFGNVVMNASKTVHYVVEWTNEDGRKTDLTAHETYGGYAGLSMRLMQPDYDTFRIVRDDAFRSFDEEGHLIYEIDGRLHRFLSIKDPHQMRLETDPSLPLVDELSERFHAVKNLAEQVAKAKAEALVEQTATSTKDGSPPVVESNQHPGLKYYPPAREPMYWPIGNGNRITSASELFREGSFDPQQIKPKTL